MKHLNLLYHVLAAFIVLYTIYQAVSHIANF